MTLYNVLGGIDDSSFIGELLRTWTQDGGHLYDALRTPILEMVRLLHRIALVVAVYLSCAVANNSTVDLTYSVYRGTALSNGITQWLGIRYAAAPVGDLRFAPPQDPVYVESVQQADQHGKLCLATGDSPSVSTTSEDCLFLDVYAPTNATADSQLPVFFFIQGGGFNSNANPNFNGSGLIAASDDSIVVVTFNYRVGPYGFITGPGLTANNGLRDQRKALDWVQQHISKFGGDPDHVVLGGDSAGAASITLQLTAFGGQDMQLFHASAAESQSFATVLTVEESSYQTENFASALSCPSPSSSNSPDNNTYLSCLRSKNAAELQAANQNIPYPASYSRSNFTTTQTPLYMWNPAIDYDFISDYTYAAFAKGAFIDVPVIFGDDTNGGTIFTPRDTASVTESDQFLVNQFPFLTDDDLDAINAMYPNPNASCEYGSETANGCYWRQVSDAYGELRYMCPGLYLSSVFSQDHTLPDQRQQRDRKKRHHHRSRSWNYRFNVEDPDQIAMGLGVPHTTEVNAIFGPENVPAGSAPASYFHSGVNAPVVPVIMAYWTSFIRTFDPSTYRYPGSARWDAWTANPDSLDGRRLVFQTGGVTEMEYVDEGVPGQRERCIFLTDIGVAVKQ